MNELAILGGDLVPKNFWERYKKDQQIKNCEKAEEYVRAVARFRSTFLQCLYELGELEFRLRTQPLRQQYEERELEFKLRTQSLRHEKEFLALREELEYQRLSASERKKRKLEEELLDVDWRNRIKTLEREYRDREGMAELEMLKRKVKEIALEAAQFEREHPEAREYFQQFLYQLHNKGGF